MTSPTMRVGILCFLCWLTSVSQALPQDQPQESNQPQILDSQGRKHDRLQSRDHSRGHYTIEETSLGVLLLDQRSGRTWRLQHDDSGYGWHELSRNDSHPKPRKDKEKHTETSKRRVSVTGKVMLDGKPLGIGTIQLVPVKDTRGPVVGAVIKEGKYSFGAGQRLSQGTYRVEIAGFAQNAEEVPNLGTDKKAKPVVQLIPKRYNQHSSLMIETRTGSNVMDFELRSGEE